MCEFLAVTRCIHREGLVEAEQGHPVVILGLLIQFIGIFGRKAVKGLKDAQGCAAADICLIKRGEVSVERDHTFAGLNILGAEPPQLFGQDLFKSLKGLGHHVKFIACHDCKFVKVEVLRPTVVLFASSDRNFLQN